MNEKLLQECHDMLKEILDYIRESQTEEFKNNQHTMDFIINVAANICSEVLEEDIRTAIRSNFKNKGRK